MKMSITIASKDETIMVDGLELLLENGNVITLDWAESDYTYSNGECAAEFTGVKYAYEGEDDYESLDNKLSMLEGATVSDVIVYSDINGDDNDFTVTEIFFHDEEDSCSLSCDALCYGGRI